MPAAAQDQPREERLDFLVRFFDLNEISFAYFSRCISGERMPDPVFMSNFDYVANALYDELVRRYPDQNPDIFRQNILRRRALIQKRFGVHFHHQGCESDSALSAASHYQEFRGIDTGGVERFIAERSAATP